MHDHPDSAGSGGGHGPTRRGKDHLDDRHVIALARIAQHRRARGVAGDHEGLHALGDEVVEAVEGVLAHLADGLGAVRLAGGVAEVQQGLVRQLVENGARDRQPPEAGVEDPDRRVAHVQQRTAEVRPTRGSASQATSASWPSMRPIRTSDDDRNSGDAGSTWRLHGGMVVEVIDGRALDSDTAAQLAAVSNADSRVDAPHLEPVSGEHIRLDLKHGWDARGTENVVAARVDGVIAAYATVDLPEWDNRHMAFSELYAHPDHQASSLAEQLLDEVYDVMKAHERTLLVANAWRGSWLERFWNEHGLEMASEAAQRRLAPAGLDWPRLDALHAEALVASGAYDVFEVTPPVADDLIEGMVQLQLAMNDAPLNDLALEDHTWNAARYRDFETAMSRRRMTSYRLVARHRETGGMAGFTAVVVEEERPHLGFQEDTAVVRSHRGHRLGLRLKIEMLRLLRDREPQIRQIDTWNALSNKHMIAVNEALGCFVVGYGGELQRDLGKGEG